jgi:Leucine rich repeat
MQAIKSSIIFCVVLIALSEASSPQFWHFDDKIFFWRKTHDIVHTATLNNIDMRSDIFTKPLPDYKSPSLIKEGEEVEAIYITNTTNTTIPQYYIEFFENAISFRIDHTDYSKVTAFPSRCSHLQNLYLGENAIKSIDHNAFSNLFNVVTLYLNNNYLTHLSDETFSKMVNLELIMLSNNRLSSINSKHFDGNTKLETIFLDNNELSVISSHLFGNANLRVIDLRENNCIDMKNGYYNLKQIKCFVESNCTAGNLIYK